jgi:FAD/FMN-containing dehydrogenase/Fe-S oxidoreductase
VKAEKEQLAEFGRELSRSFSGEIRLDSFYRKLYSTDASIYQIEPLAVLLPKSHEDVAAGITVASHFGLPVLSRGGGTSLAGQTVASAVVIDYSKYMDRILEINLEEAWARVQPGLVLDQFNARLGRMGYQLGADVATGNRATLGGMLGNNSCGARSVVYGKMIDQVLETRALLAGGSEVSFAGITPEEWDRKAAKNTLEGRLYRDIGRLIENNREEIETRYPKIMRRVGGYNLDSMLAAGGRNLSWLIVGSEGTLAACSEIKVRLVPSAKHKGLSVVHFSDLIASLEPLVDILSLGPVAIEMVDRTILDLTRAQPAFARKMGFVQGYPEAILIVEFYGDSPDQVMNRLQALERTLSRRRAYTGSVRITDAESQADVWAVRKAGLGMLSSVRGEAKPIAFVEDTAVPVASLPEYMRRFRKILEAEGILAGFYGHASVGLLHVRPLMNLKDGSQVRKMSAVAAAVKDLVVEFKGAMSGEHGDGIVRSVWNRELFGERLYGAFRELKHIFDPAGIMNPGKIVDSPPMDQNLRFQPGYGIREFPTHLDFSREGGLGGAIERCTGLGVCRKSDVGTMCPSYMATLEEEDSTRGRANALRSVLSGETPLAAFAGPELHRALDLCLECKACKTECPANVDMAKLKFEYLAHHHASHGTPLRSLIFGNIAQVSRIGSAMAPVSNWILGSTAARRLIQPALGIHPERTMPVFVRETFQKWLRTHPPKEHAQAKVKVVLFNDTFTNYNEPGVGISAMRLLEDTGAQVFVPPVVCCGRPMISKGLLEQAKEHARRNVEILTPYVEQGAFIVGCEPSCILTLRDEYPDLVGTPGSRALAERVLLPEEFLVMQHDSGLWRPGFRAARKDVLLHGHCHQKSLVGTGPVMKLLRMPAGFRVTELDAGCCGMAGAFGYESEHYEISMRIGGLRLFPAIREVSPETEIVASGLSCRQQIWQGTGRKARHFLAVIAGALEETDAGGRESGDETDAQ